MWRRIVTEEIKKEGENMVGVQKNGTEQDLMEDICGYSSQEMQETELNLIESLFKEYTITKNLNVQRNYVVGCNL